MSIKFKIGVTQKLIIGGILILVSSQGIARKFDVTNDSHRDLYVKAYDNGDSMNASASKSSYIFKGKTKKLKCGSKRCKIHVYSAYKDAMGIWQHRSKYIKKKNIKRDVTIYGDVCSDGGLSCFDFD